MTTKLSHNMRHQALLAIFASEARIAVLRVFMLDPSRAYYQRQIEAATGLAIRAVQRELERLSAIALLYRRTEGNRTYYQVDTHYPLFPELRGILLKMSDPTDRIRGLLALEESVCLALLNEPENRVLIVTTGGKRPDLAEPSGFVFDVMSSEEFTDMLSDNTRSLDAFLVHGVDLLGRREDVIWRRIETAGYAVKKGKGVP